MRSDSRRCPRAHHDCEPGTTAAPLIAGDAIVTAEQKIAELNSQIEANRDLSTSLAFD
jgi:hypothetical protein